MTAAHGHTGCAARCPQEIVGKIEGLRGERWTGKQIATQVGVSSATVSRVLRRMGLNKLSALELEPVRPYEREKPGESPREEVGNTLQG